MQSLGSWSLALLNGVMVPASIIVMMSALLFFLIEVRGVLLPGGGILSWVGACFIVATVLIARFGKLYGDASRLWLYQSALFGVTFLAALSFESPAGGLAGAFSSAWLQLPLWGIILGSVWWLSTSITRQLSLEDDAAQLNATTSRLSPPSPDTHLQLSPKTEWHKYAFLNRILSLSNRLRGHTQTDLHGNPARPIGRLILLGLACFALGEPILLQGPPEAGIPAMRDMVLFLLAAGMLMSTASSVGMVRRIAARDGDVSLGVVPARLGSAALLMVVVLSLGLLLPGVRYVGTGTVAPSGWILPEAEKEQKSSLKSKDGKLHDKTQSGDGDEALRQPDEGRSSAPPLDSGPSAPPSSELLNSLAGLGGMLIKPLLFLVFLLVPLFLWRQRSSLPNLFAALRRTASALLDDLRSAWRLLLPGRAEPSSPPVPDPFAGIEALEQLPPNEAVQALYARVFTLAEALGSPPPPGRTPGEFLLHLPLKLRGARTALEALTTLYVQAAYSQQGVDGASKARAFALFRQLPRVEGARVPGR